MPIIVYAFGKLARSCEDLFSQLIV